MKCKICKTDFEPKTKRGLFCSNICRQKNHRIENKILLNEIKKNKKTIKVELPKTEKKVFAPNVNDPKEGSMAFILKYGVSTYEELNKLNNK